MITVYSPRIHNLGDFLHCLPALSGLYNMFQTKISFGICDRLQRFNGIKDLLLHQDMFSDVFFISERPMVNNYIIVDDTGRDSDENINAMAAYRNVNFINDNYKLGIQIDNDFELKVPFFGEIDYLYDKILIADRWSPSDAPDVDDRRKSNLLKNSGKFEGDAFHYLDYSHNLVYNSSLIKYNPNPLYTTFTGTGILADLMNKEVYILYDDDVAMWDGKPVEHSYNLHYIKNRKSKLRYIKEFEYGNN
jgi:hypothetical protein